MLHELKVYGLPETSDSLAWSEAGDLCVATGVKVNLYLPAHKVNPQNASSPSLRPWTSLFLTVNLFTEIEWPRTQQLPYADFSIGEEESESHVVSSSWSAPGLAQHDRCMLGILTANGLYSLWDANGDLSFSTSWKRVLIINHVLKSFFASKEGETSKILPRRHRVRATAWTKQLKASTSQEDNKQIFILALLNDQGEIIFLKLEHTENKEYYQPSCRVLHVLDLECKPSQYPDGLLDELQWLDWKVNGGSAYATLLCSTEGRTWAVGVQLDDYRKVEIDITCTVSQPGIRAIPAWNTSKTEVALLSNKYFTEREQGLMKAWKRDESEGYPGFTRCYGIARYKDFQAIHVSFHPRTVIEYHIQAQELSYVLFSHSALEESTTNAENLSFDWETSVALVAAPENSAACWAFVLSEARDLRSQDDLDGAQTDPFAQILRLYLVMAFFRGWQITETSNLLAKLSGRPLQQETLEVIDEYREESSSKEATQQIESVVDSYLKQALGIEICSVCQQRLKWHGETGTICEQGHYFDRCSLTLLAIQEPGISNFCNSCNREYIDKGFLLKNGDALGLRSQQFLTRLFKTFPKCVYCAGTLRSYS